MRSLCAAAVAVVALFAVPCAASATTYTSPGGDLVLRASGSKVELARDGAVVASAAPGADWRIHGADGTADTLRVENPAGGVLDAHVTFDGGDGAGVDALDVAGGHADSAHATATGQGSGSLVHTGGGATLSIDYSGLEPVLDAGSATNFTQTYTSGNDAITIDNGTADGDGRVRVDTPATEEVEFANKTNVTIDGGGGNDTVTIDNSDAPTGLTGTMTVMTAANPSTSTSVGDASYGSGTLILNTSGAVSDLNGTANNVSADGFGAHAGSGIATDTQVGRVEADTDDGSIGITNVNLGGVRIGGVSASLHGLRVGGDSSGGSGNTTFSTLGALTLNDATGPEAVRGGLDAGAVTLKATGAFSTTAGQNAARAPAGQISIQATAFDVAAGSHLTSEGATTFFASVDCDVGGTGSGTALSDAELDEVTASLLTVDCSAVHVTAATSIDAAKVQTVNLHATAGDVDQTAPLEVANLAVLAPQGRVFLTNAANVVAALTGASTEFLFHDAGALTVTGVHTTDDTISISAAGTLTVNGPIQSDSNAVGLGTDGVDGLLESNAAIEGVGAFLTADRMALENGTVDAHGGSVSVLARTSNRSVDLGSASDPNGSLNLSDAEIDTLTAGTEVGIAGPNDGGRFTVSQPISAAHTPMLSLSSDGGFAGPGSLSADRIALFDESVDERAWTIDPTSVSDGHTPIGHSTGELEVDGGAVADAFDVHASPTTKFRIFGGQPSGAPGDSLVYSNGGHPAGGDTTPPSGNITAPGVQPVVFGEIEALQLDVDGDGVPDGADNCRTAANAGQADFDRDGRGDACDADRDGDGQTQPGDNCPDVPNPGQVDRDHDGIGSACDPQEVHRAACSNVFTGTPRDDTLLGTSGGDRIAGRGGADVIRGRAGGDCLSGDSGGDRVFGDAGADRLRGGRGDDLVSGGAGNDRILRGDGGDDVVRGGAGRDRLAGGSGDDRLRGGPGADWLSGGSGDDDIEGGSGHNRLFGRAGNDFIDSNNGVRDVVNCGGGKDGAVVDELDRVRGCERVGVGL